MRLPSVTVMWFAMLPAAAAADAADRPNILWISIEDVSPDFGFAGNRLVNTPHLDALAADSTFFRQAFATAGVCAPSRSAIITGRYQFTLGTQHMRSTMPRPPVPLLPELMREHGYFTSNNHKQDYNFPAPSAWDADGKEAHWRMRPAGKPFFSVFNFSDTHEQQTWILGGGAKELRRPGREDVIVNPDDVVVPPGLVDTPPVREHLANYYDRISCVDADVGRLLDELRQDGLAEETIIFVWGDHGRGLPGGKFWVRTAGTRVPLLMRVPATWRTRWPARIGDDDRICSLLDLFPSALDAAAIAFPPGLHGVSLLRDPPPDRRFVLSARDRVGPRQDMSRALRNHRWLYLRNFVHDLPAVPRDMPWYFAGSPIQREMWEAAPDTGFFSQQRMPAEELYDLEADPHELANLADHPDHQDLLAGLRAQLRGHLTALGDTGFIPECDLVRELEHRAARAARAEMDGGLADEARRSAPDWIWDRGPLTAERKQKLLAETASARTAHRYWALRELMNHADRLDPDDLNVVQRLLDDASRDVSLQAVRLALHAGRMHAGNGAAVAAAIRAGLQDPYAWTRTVALGILDEMPAAEAVGYLPDIKRTQAGAYVGSLKPWLLKKLAPEGIEGSPGQVEARQNSAVVAVHEAKLLALVGAFRADLGQPELPFVACIIGEMVDPPRLIDNAALSRILLDCH